ncbi:hypothetical protein SUGI_0348970 [Cryptomeria japonica]|nr:hypothetical protein SUGI_0348970 [Cryptomeria japonica]
MAEENQRELCVVMFPWLAHGHIAPFVQLAKSLATHGLKIFFVSTPLNIKRIRPQMFDAPGIDLVELAMPSVEGLPAGVESTADVGKRGEAPVLIPLLIAAMDLLEKPFEALLKQLLPDFVIHNLVQPWAPRVANPIPTMLFLILGVASFSFEQGQLDSALGNPTVQDLTGQHLRAGESGSGVQYVFGVGRGIRRVFAEAREAASRVRSNPAGACRNGNGFGGKQCVVPLGSACRKRVAARLLRSDREKGLVETKWVPQLDILNPPFTGAFLTHCGWNSMTEGLSFGVPLIILSMQFEQGLNAKLAEKLKVGVEVRKNEEDGSFTKEDISKAIKVIMIEEEGAQIKYNVTNISDMLTSNNFQVSERNMRNFVSTLRTFNK